MTHLLLELAIMLLVILAAAELFTNALEHLGERLKISEGVTGSLFAAVGTALPETLVPLLAIMGSSGHIQVNQEIGIGAILGAPLMLSTLSTFLMVASVLRARGLRGKITPEPSGFKRDLNFFLVAFVLAVLAMYVPHHDLRVRALFSFSLVAVYLTYIAMTVRASDQLVEDGHGTESHAKMLLSRLGVPTNLLTIALQLALAVGLLLWGAEGFIEGIRGVSERFGISALLLSPEKVNSILWIRRRKDTLAFGNITGAMVFQGTLLPAIGILLTPWTPNVEVVTGILITLLAAAWMRVNARASGTAVWILLLNGLLYVSYLAITLSR